MRCSLDLSAFGACDRHVVGLTTNAISYCAPLACINVPLPFIQYFDSNFSCSLQGQLEGSKESSFRRALY